MLKILNKILIKLRIIRERTGIEAYLQNGNISIGANSKTEGLSVNITNPKQNVCNLIIGSNCMISGSITIHNPNAVIFIGDRVFIGPNTELFCYEGITIESDVMLSWGITVIDTNAHSLEWENRKNDVEDWMKGSEYKNWAVVESKAVKIESKSWIGFKSIILKGVVIKEGSVVGSGSVVSKSTEPFSIVAGNPAVLIKRTK